MLPANIDWFVPSALSYLCLYRILFLLLTHIFVTLFVAVDAIFASKLLYSSLSAFFLISIVQLLYSGSRPFWDSG